MSLWGYLSKLRTLSISLSLSLFLSLSLAFTLSLFLYDHTWNFLTFPNFLMRMPLWKKNPKIAFVPSKSTFGTPSTEIILIFFASIKIIIIQTLVEIIFIYHYYIFIWNIYMYKYRLENKIQTKFFRSPKKFLLQTIVEIIFIYQIFFRVLGQNEFFYIWGVGYQNRVKRVCGVHFWRNILKIFKN